MSRARRQLERAWKRAGELGLEAQLAELAERAVDTAAAAAAQYDCIRWGQEPDRVFASSAPEVRAGDTLTELGILEQIEYSGAKGGRAHIWFHPFEPDKPRLCVTREARLVIVGGDYTVTEAGIVG